MESARVAAAVINSGDKETAHSCAVHPGWLGQEAPVPEISQEAEDTARFDAFLQLIRTSGAIDRAATDVLADLDLTAGAFGALLELGAAYPGGLAPSELARTLAVARRTATLYVDILERQGWAERKPHPDDRRMVLARLTPVGRRLLDELGEAYKRRLAALLDDMTLIQAERLRQLLALIAVNRPHRVDAESAPRVVSSRR
ncbi:MAG: MarR family winged helix-turn-helix transcriptional regulator [Thermomicrobiales bacterium]